MSSNILDIGVFTASSSRTAAVAVAFTVYISRDDILGSNQVIKYDRVIENYGNAYSSFSGMFSAPVSGVYSFAATVMTFGEHYMHAEIVKNGYTLAYLFGPPHDGYSNSQVVYTHLNNGDRVWVKHPSGVGSQQIHKTYSSFSGCLINSDT